MAAIQRSSKVDWEGTIARGTGRLSAHSGAFTALPVTVASRFGEPEGKPSLILDRSLIPQPRRLETGA